MSWNNLPIEVMDVKTREIVCFDSMQKCSKFFKVRDKSLMAKLKLNQIKIPYRGYFVKYKSDTTPWPEKHEIIQLIKYRGVGITLTCIKTNVTTTYGSLRAAGKAIGISNVALHNRLKNESYGPVKGYMISKYK